MLFMAGIIVVADIYKYISHYEEPDAYTYTCCVNVQTSQDILYLNYWVDSYIIAIISWGGICVYSYL